MTADHTLRDAADEALVGLGHRHSSACVELIDLRCAAKWWCWCAHDAVRPTPLPTGGQPEQGPMLPSAARIGAQHAQTPAAVAAQRLSSQGSLWLLAAWLLSFLL